MGLFPCKVLKKSHILESNCRFTKSTETQELAHLPQMRVKSEEKFFQLGRIAELLGLTKSEEIDK